MKKHLLSNIHIVIICVLLLFTQAKIFVESSSYSSYQNDTATSCISSERSALVGFKAGLSDPTNLLSSWKGDDCCKWKGVQCSSRNNHVVKLDLRGRGCAITDDETTQLLGGNICSSLLGLQHLQYLNLSCNEFYEVQIPEFLGSLHKLRYIDLSRSSFIGRIPPHLGNLSKLRYLNLASDTYSMDITWLSQLTSLQHLDLSGTNLSTIVRWLPVVSILPSLKVLRLRDCNLRTSSASLQLSNLTSLETLDLSSNSFHTSITPNWFWGLTSLKHLDISWNGFHGQFPNEMGNMTSIVKLVLSSNNLVGMIPSNLENLCSLEVFGVGGNNINGRITELFPRLPCCSLDKLRNLDLSSSNLTGGLPANLPSVNLFGLDLSCNMLSSEVPLWIEELTVLDVGFINLVGFIHEGHLSGLKSLDRLWLSNNSIALIGNSMWVPPFNLLTDIGFRSCLLRPKFSSWLRWLTHLHYLGISDTSISDTVPYWFWITTFCICDRTRLSRLNQSTVETLEDPYVKHMRILEAQVYMELVA